MKKTIIGLLLIISGFAFGSTYQELVKAYHSGEISYDQYLEYNVYALSGSQLLPAQFKNSDFEPVKCFTALMQELDRANSRFPEKAGVLYATLKTRPTMQFSFNSPAGLFKIHYNTTGGDAVLQPTNDVNPADGVPDYVNRAAEYCDYVWHTEVDSMGYLPPPADGVNGGDSKYDIYLKKYSGAYGVTFFENYTGNPNPRTATSYIFMDPAFVGFSGTPLGNLKVTAAHEFHHAIQFAYDANESSWYKEISSTWMEDIVYDDINDYYNYLTGFFSVPEVSLSNANGIHEYASCIFNHYLSQSYGDSLIRQMWEGMVGLNANEVFTTLDNVLAGFGSNKEQALAGFTTWNYLTGFRRTESATGYEEGAQYPQVNTQTDHFEFPVDWTSPANALPDHFGSNYIVLHTLPDSGTALINFEGNQFGNWCFSILTLRNGNWTFESQAQPQASYSGIVRHLEDVSEIALVPAVTTLSGNDWSYSYRVNGFLSDTLFVETQSISFTDSSSGNANGRFEPGESIAVSVNLHNYGPALDTVDVSLVSNTAGVTISNPDFRFGTIAADTVFSVSRPFNVSCDDTVSVAVAKFSLRFSIAGQNVLTLPAEILLGTPKILVVDDDGGLQSESQLLSDLNELQLVFESMTADSLVNPDLLLGSRNKVIWHLGGSNLQINYYLPALRNYLDNGGNLIISGSAVTSADVDSAFRSDYLHIVSGAASPTQFLKGETGDPIGNNALLSLNNGSYPMFDTDGSAYSGTSFKWFGQSLSGVTHYNYFYKVIVMGFGFNEIYNGSAQFITSLELLQRSMDWLEGVTAVKVGIPQMPDQFDLQANFPNPFNPVTTIVFSLPVRQDVELSVFDMNGRKVVELFRGSLNPGLHNMSWDGRDAQGRAVASGVYLARLKSRDQMKTHKMLLVK